MSLAREGARWEVLGQVIEQLTRENPWENIRRKRNWDEGALCKKESVKYPMAEAVRAAYQSWDDDESLGPRVLVDDGGKPLGRFQDGDCVIFYNIRGEREVELCQSLLNDNFAHFPVARNIRLNFVTMIPYDKRLKVMVAFPPEEEVRDTLSEVLSSHGLRQVKISESEKAIHVSYFLNGKVREPFPGEERIVIPSPKDVPYFDQKPEMNAAGVAEAVIHKLGDPEINFIFANFANIDVVGHIENERAIEDGSFFKNEAFLWAIRGTKEGGKNLHLLGIVSFFSSHGSVNHLMALLKLAKQESVGKLYLHVMLGRRGEHRESGARYIELIEKEMENLSIGQIASVIGRYWSLDREENWDRIEKTYRMLVYGEGTPVLSRC